MIGIPGTDASTIQLIQGGFRTITGNIGKQNKQAYEAKIGNLATIGIRGTDYEAVITPAGEVLTGVYDGGTTVGNSAGALSIGAAYDFAQIVGPDTPPEGLLFQPPGLGEIPQPVFDEPEEDADNSADDTDDNGTDSNDGAIGAGDSDDTNTNSDDDANDASTTTASNGNAQNTGASTIAASNNSQNSNDSANDSSVELEAPSANFVAQTARAGSVSELVRNDQQDSSTGVTVNPSETGNSVASCATNSSLCLQLADGGVSDVGTDSGNSNNGNPANNGNGNSADGTGSGNSSDSGNGNGNGNGKNAISSPAKTIESANINWGKWDNPVDSNWVVVQQVEDKLVRVSSSNYFADVNPSPIARLTGSHSYATGIVSSFIGSGSAGDISSLIAGMDVNFDTGVINNGSLDILAGDQTWSVNFEGLVQAGAVDLNVIQGQLFDSSGVISNAIGGDLGGVFTGNKAEAFVGGFDLLDIINPLNSIDGLFTIER